MGTQLRPPHKGGRAPSQIFGPCLLWPNGWMDQDGIWRRGGRWSTPHCVCARWRPSSPAQKGGSASNFRPISIVAKRLYAVLISILRMPLGTEVGLSLGDIVLDGYPAPPPIKGHSPNFRPMSVMAKRLYESGYHLVRR